jgi:hypothetical protein
MEKYIKIKSHRSFRRFVRRAFTNLIKRQNISDQVEFQKMVMMLRSIQDSIEIVAREMTRQTMRRK